MNKPGSRRQFLISLGASATTAEGLGGKRAFAASGQIARAGERYIDPRKVLPWECTRKEIREAMESGRVKTPARCCTVGTTT